MARLMSVAHTEASVRDRTKDVTRRLGWQTLPPRADLDLVRKAMGRGRRDTPGFEPLVRIARVHVVSVGRVRLDSITDDDARREGVAGVTTGAEFVEFYRQAFDCKPDRVVTRIEWRYLFDYDRFTPAPAGPFGEERWWCSDCIPAITSRELHDAAHHLPVGAYP